MLGFTPRVIQLVLGRSWEGIFLISSQMMLMLMVGDQTLRSSGLVETEGMLFEFVMEAVTLHLGILFPLAVHSEPESAMLFVFWSSRNQSAGDKFHYSTFFEFSQGVLSIPLLVLALFCYFKDLLVFPRWFFLSPKDVKRNTKMMYLICHRINVFHLILIYYLLFSFLYHCQFLFN